MNNCPKCGNPLQPGVTSCPICGTELSSTEPKNTQKTVASVAAPVQQKKPQQAKPQQAVAIPPSTQPQQAASSSGQQNVKQVSTAPAPIQVQLAPVQAKPAAPQAKPAQSTNAANPAPVQAEQKPAPSQPQAVVATPAAPQPQASREIAITPAPVTANVEPQVVSVEEQPVVANPVVIETNNEPDIAQVVEQVQQEQQGTVAPQEDSSQVVAPVPVVIEDSNTTLASPEEPQPTVVEVTEESTVPTPVVVTEDAPQEVKAPTVVTTESAIQPQVVSVDDNVAAPVVVSNETSPQVEQPVVLQPQPVPQPTVQPVTQPVVQQVQSVQTEQPMAVSPQQPVVLQQPTVVNQGSNVVGGQVPPAPIVTNNTSGAMPIPGIPSSLGNNQMSTLPNTPVTNDTSKGKVKKEKASKVKKDIGEKKSKKGLLLIILIVLIFASLAGYFLLTSNKSNGNKKPKPASKLTAGTVTSNGYKFSLADGWIVTEGNGNVIITNTSDDSTVQMKLSNSVANIDNITVETIQNYVKTNDNIKNSKIEEMTISAKKAFLLNATFNDLPIQVYFIGGGSRLLIGATVVYSSEDSKIKHEATVQEIIGSISFSDDSVKALDIINMYTNIFSIYNNVIIYSQNPSAFIEGQNNNDINNEQNNQNNSQDVNQNQNTNNDGEQPENNQANG